MGANEAKIAEWGQQKETEWADTTSKLRTKRSVLLSQTTSLFKDCPHAIRRNIVSVRLLAFDFHADTCTLMASSSLLTTCTQACPGGFRGLDGQAVQEGRGEKCHRSFTK